MASSTRPTASKRQRELDQKDRVAERATRRADRKARAADRVASGNAGPPIGEPIAPSEDDAPFAFAGQAAAASSPAQDTTMGNRLYVGNLSYTTDTESIRELFATKGEVSDVQVVMDRESGRPRGFAFVTMGTSAAAQKAISELNGASLDNRALRVNEAEERRDRGGGGGGGGGGGRGRY